MHDYDVIIAGAGPAGSTAALALARSGYRVLLAEKESFPREKACGEGMLPGAVRALADLGLRGEIEAAGAVRFDEIRFHFSLGSAVTLPMGAEFGGLAFERSRLDKILASAAERAGADVRFGCEVISLRSELGAVRATCRLEKCVTAEISSCFAVVAAGPTARLALDAARRGGHGRFGFACHVSDQLCRKGVDVHVGPDHEVYIAPAGHGKRVVSVLCDREVVPRGANIRDRFVRLLRDARAPDELIDEIGGQRLEIFRAGSGFGTRASRASTGRILSAGDAYYTSDPVAAQGIYLALSTGRSSAVAIDRALREEISPNAAGAAYARSVEPIRDRSHFVAMSLLRLIRRPRLWRRIQPFLRGKLLEKFLGLRPPTFVLRHASSRADYFRGGEYDAGVPPA